MATIAIHNLDGSAFFSDAETYLMELGETELRLQGGNEPTSNLVDAPLYSRYFDTAPTPVPQPQPQSGNC